MHLYDGRLPRAGAQGRPHSGILRHSAFMATSQNGWSEKFAGLKVFSDTEGIGPGSQEDFLWIHASFGIECPSTGKIGRFAIKSGKDYIIFPLDVSTYDEAMKYVTLLKDSVGLFKVGLELFASQGPAILIGVREITNAKVFLDLKLHDIPETMRRAFLAAAQCGTGGNRDAVKFLSCFLTPLGALGSLRALRALGEGRVGPG